ncbi:MAG: ComF family protein [Gammaproteobacteria bacterium]
MLLRALQRLIYPPACLLCQAPGSADRDICQSCLADLPRINHACASCAMPIPRTGEAICGACQRTPPAFDATATLFHYAAPVDWLLRRLKFQGKLSHARLLGRLTAEHLARTITTPPQRIVPVPLHLKRLAERGFNQAFELAKPVGAQMGVQVDCDNVHRILDTRPQMELPANQRRKNIRNAFEINPALEADHVAIFDDVMTTGATVDELARALKLSGIARVDVWVCARAGRH